MTIIAAFSFLFHFGMVGAIYSDWMDPVVDDEAQHRGPHRLGEVAPAASRRSKPHRKRQHRDRHVTAAPTAEAPKAAARRRQGCRQERLDEHRRARAISSAARSARNGHARRAEQPGAGDRRRAQRRRRPDRRPRRGRAVGRRRFGRRLGGLNLGGGGGGVAPARMARRRPRRASAPPPLAPRRRGHRRRRSGPKGNANVGGAEVSRRHRSPTPTASSRACAAGFRACYNRGLASNPDLQGLGAHHRQDWPQRRGALRHPQRRRRLSGDEVVSCVVRRVSERDVLAARGRRRHRGHPGDFRSAEVSVGSPSAERRALDSARAPLREAWRLSAHVQERSCWFAGKSKGVPPGAAPQELSVDTVISLGGMKSTFSAMHRRTTSDGQAAE